jgi:hypothetical protein
MAQMRRLRGSMVPNIRGADGSPCGVIAQMIERYCDRLAVWNLIDGQRSAKAKAMMFCVIRLTADEHLQVYRLVDAPLRDLFLDPNYNDRENSFSFEDYGAIPVAYY